jgi:carbon monoxide dehydrogenase subunit G
MDPSILARCLPGCERLEPEGENSYRAFLKIGVAAVKGSYTGTVRMEDLDPPSSYRLIMEGKGAAGFVRGTASISLEEHDARTDMKYSGDVQVGGLIASVGQRMLQGLSKTMLHQFFTSLESELVGDGPR